MMRTCDTTGLPVCLNAQKYIKLNAVMAVVFLLVGAIMAILLALTRWPAVHLLGADHYYRFLTAHGMNMLIFWIIFFEIAILYFAATTLLKCRLASVKAAFVSFALMVVGALMVNFIVFAGKADVLMTSYLPLLGHPLFYLGIILFAVGALIGVFNFFATIYIARRDKTYTGSMPLVTFGAVAAAIIAVFALLHGAIAMIPTFLHSVGVIDQPDPGWYRLIWWGLGHSSQQINVCAMVACWYFLANLTTGAKPLNEAVCRGAFVLYIFFINLASAHHLLVDPGVGAEWKIWNTSYAMYLAVLASMIHGFTVPASVEVAMRGKGYTRGLFGWLRAAPWSNPAFSAFILSLVIFGFIGGITGVTLGTQQINIIAHNTLRIPGHFHATVVGGTSLAFMGLAYYVVPLIFQREYKFRRLAKIQPWLFAIGITLMSFGMSFAGSSGVPRRHWDTEFTGSILPAGFQSDAYLWLGLVGIGGTLAFLGLLIFILNTVHAVFFGERNVGRAMTPWHTPKALAPTVESAPPAIVPTASGAAAVAHRVPGTLVLVLVLLASFAVYYFANWKALSDVWQVR
ncbi:MAG: cbb3-type cytochrome c oxidase subunit I [Deltaproteobacteria bacterium]|nr:cbb3-type cytochrome c oxidase subunit I [Deltaproteobacteria bacterium]